MKQIAFLTGNSNISLASCIVQDMHIIREKHPEYYSPNLHLINSNACRFKDGESYCFIEESVRGSEVFIIQSTSTPVNDNLMELLLMIDAAKRASAGHITAVIPYFGYARQDRKNKRRDPISARLVANLIETAGANRILTMDLHAKQIQGFFSIPVDNLMGVQVFAEYFSQNPSPWIKEFLSPEKTVVVSPDVGGALRARSFALRLGLDQIAIINKRRDRANECEIMNIIGDVKGKKCIVIDDIIDTGGTLFKGAYALKDQGAEQIIACVSHGVLSQNAIERALMSAFDKIYLLDTIERPDNMDNLSKFHYLSTSYLFAEAIDNIYRDTSFDKAGL